MDPSGNLEARPVPATRLKKRSDFLRVATGSKAHTALVTVQTIAQLEPGADMARVGFTVTKRVGNAVERNRIRRRLREAVRLTPCLGIRPSHDFVIVARRTVLDQPFEALCAGLRLAIGKAGSRRERRPTAGRLG